MQTAPWFRNLICCVVGLSVWHPCLSREALSEDDTVTRIATPDGIEFGVLEPQPTVPAPTLFVFASTYSDALRSPDFNRVGQQLRERGVLCVSLDLSCHGADHREGEPAGLAGWRHRLDQGEDPILPFCRRAAAALDHLIALGLTDKDKVAACGTSRGGFAAMHFAAYEPRVRCVAGFAPVTDLLILQEFHGMSPETPAVALKLTSRAQALSTRPVWICIGNHDERVGTDSAVALARQITAAAIREQKPSAVDLHVQPSVGHRTPKKAHDDAANWISEQLNLPRN